MINNHKKLQNWFLHIDLDAFFASVEQLDNPEYRGKPVIVGGHKDDKRGVVSTASYEARNFGVHSAMPIFQAIRLCPEGIYLRPRMKRYTELSFQIMNIFKDFSPDVEQMSIDEAFLDLTGTEQLFGPPEETALIIKKRVKEETGLTVSIGLATTKYLAKIASGYSKPDGFYFIKPGQEQAFMLELPLRKVWGVGPKALERMKKAGITTTRDIYNKPYNLLEFIFGTTMATFLYNVVRGTETESFSKKHKSHSISAEKTFSCDISDIYTAETELLELAHGVIFRILKEEQFSRTVTVKIKYDDFSTVTVQKTLDRNVITLDTFFETIKMLFEEKYQKARGIRLLGVGFDNVEPNNKPVQQSLFDTKEDKKQAVEKAILNLNKKHPEIKIQKARLLKSIAILFIIFSQLIGFRLRDNNKNIFAEEIRTEETTELPIGEEKSSIFNWDLNDKSKVDFLISGHWNLGIDGKIQGIFNKNAKPFADFPIPVFKQDIELYSLFTLNKNWYFQADFADNFSNNTIAIGYNGNNYFRTGRLSNRNITMPDSYSAEQLGFGLSGGNTQAPGFSAHWQSPSDKWSGDILLRYDMTIPMSAIFYGMNKVNNRIINIENYLYGYSFTFPEDSKKDLQGIKNVYIESKEGKYKDSNGKLYKKLSSSDYYYSPSLNVLYLSENSNESKNSNDTEDIFIPGILLTFNSPLSVDSIIKNTGSYNDSLSFAGSIQNLFNNAYKKYNLEKYSYPLKNEIENNNALVIQNSTGFSPYMQANTYNCGPNENADITVISKSTDKVLSDYVAELQNNSYTSSYEDFINKDNVYAKIINKKLNDNRFPFVETNPEIYLNIPSEQEICLQLRTYNPVTNINIGQKASTGTIHVLKNGTYIYDFIYNKNTGEVIMPSPLSNNDQIKITWEEEAADFTQGDLVLGIGFQLNILPELKWDISLTGKKPLDFESSYSTPDNIRNSFLALSTGINYSKNNFSAYDKLGFSINKQNDLDKLLVSKQEDYSNNFHNLSNYSGFETKAVPFINNNFLPQGNNHTINNHKGEKDNDIKGIRIPLQWDFSNIEAMETPWAAVDIKLDSNSSLKNSSRFKIKLKLENPLLDNNYKVFLQLGIKAGNDFYGEDYNIPTYNITDKINFNDIKWQEIEIKLSDSDRSKFVTNKDARLIIIKNNSSPNTTTLPQNNKGKIYIGPYMSVAQSIFTLADENIELYTTTFPHGKNNFSSVINWHVLNNINNNPLITATTHFTPSDFNPYKIIKMKFCYKEDSSLEHNKSQFPELSFILDTDSLTQNENGIIALKLDILNMSPYISGNFTEKNYHTVSINLENRKVYIDDFELLENQDYNLYINKNVTPSRAKYIINTIIGKKLISEGCFYLNDITFEQSDYKFNIQNIITADYKKENILKINDYQLLSNGFITGTSTQKFSETTPTVLSYINSGITVANVGLQADISMKQLNFEYAGHNIKTTTPLFNVFSFDESYRWNNNNSLIKSNMFNLNLNSFSVPITILSELKADNNQIKKEQNHNTTITSNFNINNNSFNISSSLITKQKHNLLKDYDMPDNLFIYKNNDNYFKEWFNITKYQFSIGKNNASLRNTAFYNNISLNINNNFINPSFNYNLSSSYENIYSPDFTDMVFTQLLVPINLNEHFISFNHTRTGGNTQQHYSSSYFSDLDYLFGLQTNRVWFYTSIPFYELFDNNIASKIKGNYSTKYEINYSRNISSSFKDLYIPSSASLAVIRDIKSKEKISDQYQIKATITNNSINNFGKDSKKEIFKWFKQEEISSGITGIIKIPTDYKENITYNISSFLQLLLIIDDNSMLNSFFDLSFETNMNWHTKGSIVYTRPGKTCFMSALAVLFSEKAETTEFNISRKDYFNFSVGSKDKIIRQNYEYSHSLDMSFLNYFTITSGIGLSFTHTENSSGILSLNYSLGGKISF